MTDYFYEVIIQTLIASRKNRDISSEITYRRWAFIDSAHH